MNPDEDLAGSGYLLLRTKLKFFFRTRGSSDPEDRADEVFARVLQKMREGLKLAPNAIGPYALGVARNIAKEEWRSASKHKQEELSPNMSTRSGNGAEETVLLNECLALLKPADRRLFLRYHLQDRAALAREMGISDNALRIKAYRILEEFRSRYHRKRRTF